MEIILKHIATLGPVGYIPFASGTFGTLVGLILSLIIKPSLQYQTIIILSCSITGIFAASAAEKIFMQKDSGKIVIDELAGFYVSSFHLPQTSGFLFASFLLFRFFDILKPFPVRSLERSLPGGIGVMADDIMAGIYTNIILQLWLIIILK